MCIGEYAVRCFINVQDSSIAWQTGQNDIATGGKFRNAPRDLAAICNEFLGLSVVAVVGCEPEAGFKQPPRDRPAHIADSDKSEPIVFLRDWFHDGRPWTGLRFRFPNLSKARVVPFHDGKRVSLQGVGSKDDTSKTEKA